MANINTIRDAMHVQPLRPFGLVMVDGTAFAVSHPEHLFISPGRHPREVMYCHVIDEREEDPEYRTRWLDLNLISEVVIPSEELHPPRVGPPRGCPPGTQPPTP
jgi:hypothetical protein